MHRWNDIAKQIAPIKAEAQRRLGLAETTQERTLALEAIRDLGRAALALETADLIRATDKTPPQR